MSLSRSSWVLLVVSFMLTLVFVGWAVQALQAGPLVDFDHKTARDFNETSAAHPVLRQIMVAFTYLGGVWAMALLALAGAAWQWQRGDRILAVAWAVIVAGGGLVDLTLKVALDRPRPPAAWRDPAVTETNQSFPSGHSMGSAVGYGMLGCALLPRLRRRAAKVAGVVLLAALVGCIGFSRIYLRAHWFSDVVGGFVIGAAWLTFCWAWVNCWRARRASEGGPNPAR